jgi:hypothetical protein
MQFHIYKQPYLHNKILRKIPAVTIGDEGMTNGPPIFAYLVFGPGRVSSERLLRLTKAAVWRGPGAKLDVQARTLRIQIRLVFVC